MSKVHSTNYQNVLITRSADCAALADVPTKAGSIAALQYQMMAEAPYDLTSDDILVAVTAVRQDVPDDEQGALRDVIFSKGQPCLRTSPLVKTYGWAVHHDAAGRVALVDPSSPRFDDVNNDPEITKISGMRNARAR